MTDFKKATQLIKSAQLAMFPAKVLGKTKSGKEILQQGYTPKSFKEHHKDWTANDHQDATGIHYRSAGNKPWPKKSHIEKYHDIMGDLHGASFRYATDPKNYSRKYR